MRICLLSARFPPQQCGVGDYTYFLACALERLGHEVDVLTAVGGFDESHYPVQGAVRVHREIKSWGTPSLLHLIGRIRRLRPHVLVIEYAPHSFQRRGLTLGITLLSTAVRVATTSRVIANFHELYVPFDGSMKRDLAALWQRIAAVVLAAGSHRLAASAMEWQRRLRGLGVRKSIDLIPVGSNIPLAQIGREERARLRYGLLGAQDGLLVAGLGARHDRDISAVLQGIRELKRMRRTKLVWIGGQPTREQTKESKSAMIGAGLSEADVEWTGVLPHTEISRILSASDMMVLPFIDGVSSRRTSAITGLQHGLPLLTTRGAVLEPWFVHDENVDLVPIADRGAIVAEMVRLGDRPEFRSRLGEAGRRLYEKQFAWDVIAEKVVRSLVEEEER